jgi:hypothetical protein
MKAFKGFDKDLKCRDFQYEVGKTYETDSAKLCESGFHACEHPLDVFSYYPPAGSRFAEVDLDATDETKEDDTKRVGKKITIKAELNLQGIIQAAVDFVFTQSDKKKKTKHATGYQGAASATGYQGAASATGYQGAASATGDQGAASATGIRGAASATGIRGAASATGYQGIAIACGIYGMAKASLGNWIVVSEWKDVGDHWERIAVKSARVDGKKIKPDTFYQLKDGKLQEAK